MKRSTALSGRIFALPWLGPQTLATTLANR